MELVHTDELAGSTVWLGRIKLDFAFEAYCLTYELGEESSRMVSSLPEKPGSTNCHASRIACLRE